MQQAVHTEVVVIGGCCLDAKTTPLGAVEHGTSNPAKIRLSPGGSGRNIAENLARLGVRVSLLSAVGIDMVGNYLLELTEASGVDVSRVIRSGSVSTSTYIALFTHDNQQSYALDDTSAIAMVTPQYIQANYDTIENARLLVVDGNLDTETVAAAVAIAKDCDVPVWMDPVSDRRAYALRPYLSEFSMANPNLKEAEAMLGISIETEVEAQEAARRMVAMGMQVAIITLGEEGLVYATTEAHGRIPAVRCDVVDWRGAGNALAAAVAYGILNEMPVDEAMRLGVAAATITLKSAESVNPNMSLEQIYSNIVI